MPPPPKPKLVADADPATRFAADLTAIVGGIAVDRDCFGIAVSGGPDSMAMLFMAHQLLGERMAAATVDHGLRSASADESAMVAEWCAERDIEHSILRPGQPIAGSLQAAARDARYALLNQWRDDADLQWLLTAHHADDQLETLLMRLRRGSGVGGLAGIRRRNGVVLRPLLRWRREDLRAICVDAALPFVDDPSNDDARFDRVRVRQAINGLNLFDILDAHATAQSTEALDAADRALDWSARRLIAGWADGSDDLVIRDDGYPPELLRRIVMLRLSSLDPPPELRGSALTRVLDMMAERQPAMIGDWRIVPQAGQPGSWRISRAPPRKAGSDD